MNNVKRIMTFIICFIFCFTGTNIVADAATNNNVAQPYYDYTRQATSNLHISSSGKADVSISCTGLNTNVTKITSETCLQRKVGLIWIKADIGTANDVWTYTVYKYILAKSHSTNLSKTGKYRAKTVFTVYQGTNSEKVTIYSGTDTY